jgi:hypothetical protein
MIVFVSSVKWTESGQMFLSARKTGRYRYITDDYESMINEAILLFDRAKW